MSWIAGLARGARGQWGNMTMNHSPTKNECWGALSVQVGVLLKAAGLLFGIAVSMLGGLGSLVLGQHEQAPVQRAVSEHPYGLPLFYVWACAAGVAVVAAATTAVLATFARDRASAWLVREPSYPGDLALARAGLFHAEVAAAVSAQAALCALIAVVAYVTRLDAWYEYLIAAGFVLAPGAWLACVAMIIRPVFDDSNSRSAGDPSQ